MNLIRYVRSTLLASTVCAVAALPTLAAEPTPAAAAAGEAAAPSAYVKPKITHGPYGALKFVIPLTTDDKAIQAQKLRNIANGLKAADEWQGRFTFKIVLYAKGVTLLKSPDEATAQKLDMLRSRGVQIEVCGNTLAEQNIDFHSLYHVTEADIVPSGFAEVAYLQAKEHYVVDPVN